MEAEAEIRLARIVEALLLASDQPLSLEQLFRLVVAEGGIGKKDVRAALDRLAGEQDGRSVELREVAGGFRLQIRPEYSQWVDKLWQEKPPRFSRALLETLALICYRQPVTRGEIEDIRGVALSPNIVKTLTDRGWVREVGVKEVPGRPALLGTTAQFLDDFNLKALDELPALPEIKDPQQLEAALARLGERLPAAPAQAAPPDSAAASAGEPGAEPAAGDATVH
ncbi:MAG TPA: SMC-Scp complex subunit ScpB [Candidatus Binatia bacterium]|nr:SMC-Scp complex subunit ScpB [Candidatus Binatia bacterium]